MKNIVTWYGQPILNLDQRNEIEAHLRAEIAECDAKMDEERGPMLSMWYFWFQRKLRAQDSLDALFRTEFVNPNEGMLL